MIPDLPALTGEWSAWIMLGIKAVAAMGFMAAADALILYAC
jgi:hypothetical protein